MSDNKHYDQFLSGDITGNFNSSIYLLIIFEKCQEKRSISLYFTIIDSELSLDALNLELIEPILA